jgi:hypothetical protein
LVVAVVDVVDVDGGGEERRRIAWVMAGWKGPPKGECLRRWQGRTWPWPKKAEKVLMGMC